MTLFTTMNGAKINQKNMGKNTCKKKYALNVDMKPCAVTEYAIVVKKDYIFSENYCCRCLRKFNGTKCYRCKTDYKNGLGNSRNGISRKVNKPDIFRDGSKIYTSKKAVKK